MDFFAIRHNNDHPFPARSFFGNYYVDGELIDTNYNMYQTDKHYSEALNGRAIDQSLLEETIAAYRKIPEVAGRHYTLTKEYQQYARPYSEIFNFIRQISGMQTSEVMLSWQPDEDDLLSQYAPTPLRARFRAHFALH